MHHTPAKLPRARRLSDSFGDFGVVVFAVVWLFVVGWIDLGIAQTVYLQTRAQLWFRQATATIESSQLRQLRGDSVAPAIRYSYSVAGESYHGECCEVGSFPSMSDQRARRAVRECPAEAQVAVFYNPANIAESTLTVGVTGETLCFAIFATPFNAVAIGLAFSLFAVVRGNRSFSARFFEVITEQRFTSLRPAFWVPWRVALVAGIALPLVLLSALLLAGEIDDPSTPLLIAVSVIGFGGIAASWVITSHARAAGRFDTRVDLAAQAIDLPRTWRSRARRISLADIAAIEQQPSPSRPELYRFAIRLLTGEQWRLTSWVSRTDAEMVEVWLASWAPLNLPQRSVDRANDSK